MSGCHRDAYADRCPYCGGTEIIDAFQSVYGAVSGTNHKLGGTALYHSICRRCGSVVRSFVKDPEKLVKRKERRI